MPEATSYLHPTIETESLFKDRGSKFYGYCVPTKTTEDVKSALERVAEAHPQARHVCYAYVLGPDREDYRVNDDGEPSNSAGMPIYNQIKSNEITNVLVAVVRYFGGTKLGVPGLIHAYKTAAELAIGENKIVNHVVHAYYKIKYDYPQMDAAMHVAKVNNWNIIDQKFELDCEVTVEVDLNQQSGFMQSLAAYPEIEVKHLHNA